MLLQIALFYSFLWLSRILLCVCVCVYTQTTYSLSIICQWTFRLFYFLGFVNSADMNTGVHVPFWIRTSSFLYISEEVELIDHHLFLAF